MTEPADRAPSASPEGAPPTPQLPDIDDGSYVCSKCDLPVAKINGVWRHAEHADAVVCGLLSGNPLAWAMTATEPAEPDDEDLANED
jgi:hypothetical protein